MAFLFISGCGGLSDLACGNTAPAVVQDAGAPAPGFDGGAPYLGAEPVLLGEESNAIGTAVVTGEGLPAVEFAILTHKGFRLLRQDAAQGAEGKARPRFEHPSAWGASVTWANAPGPAGATVLIRGASDDRFIKNFVVLKPDDTAVVVGQCSGGVPRMGTVDPEGSWLVDPGDCLDACPGFHATAVWFVPHGGGAPASWCAFGDVEGPRDVWLHPEERFGVAVLQPTFPGPERIRLFEFDETGITRVAPDMSLMEASAGFWPSGRRLMFGVNEAGAPYPPHVRIKQIDWTDSGVVSSYREDLSAHFGTMIQASRLADGRIVMVGGLPEDETVSGEVVVGVLEDDRLTAVGRLPRGTPSSRYEFWSDGYELYGFWNTRVDTDAGIARQVWGKRVSLEAAAGEADGG